MTRFKNWKFPEFNEAGLTKWNWMCQHPQNLKIGKGTDIGAFTYINAKHGVEIGENAQIGSHCSLYSENTIDNTKGKIIISNGSKIGSHCVILPGVKIGANAKVGAFSLVKANIPDNCLAMGIPAKIKNEKTSKDK